MPVYKPAYLIHGDDHGRIAERRANLRTKAEAESGAGGVEIFEGEAATPEAVAFALNAMTFAVGRRFIVVDGVERWKEADVEAALVPALAALAPDTTIAFFAREEGRYKAPAALEAAVRKADGVVDAEQMLRARELPRWAIDEARKLHIELDGAGAQALVAQVGERQQRLLRELEKLALEHGNGARIGSEEVEAAAASSAERQVWKLADALIARDRQSALRVFLELRAQGEDVARLIPTMAGRVRSVVNVALGLEAGRTPDAIRAGSGSSPAAFNHRLREAKAADLDSLRRALETLAQLEVDTRGGSELSDHTLALRAIGRAAAA